MTKKKTRETTQFSFNARKVCNIIVTVEAADEEEALILAKSGEWVDEQDEGMTDLEIRGRCE